MKKVNGHNHKLPFHETWEERLAFALVSLLFLVVITTGLSLYLLFYHQ